MKKVLVTGRSGFVGSHMLPILKTKYDIVAPSRQELNLKDRKSVEDFFLNQYFDVIIHLASPSPVKSAGYDSFDTLLRDCISLFTNLQSVSEHYGKMIYSGSGAEFDKTRDIVHISEDELGERIPADDYGLAKYMLTQLARQSKNCYNLRIFGCYGSGEYDYKFIKHAINCTKNNEAITIRQDCIFDYMYVDDYAKFIECVIDNTPRYHDYNACTGIGIKLSEIAEIVKKITRSSVPVVIEKEGMNNEYSGSNERFMKEFGGVFKLTSIEEGIERMISEEIATI